MEANHFEIGDLVLRPDDFKSGENVTMGRALLMLMGRLGSRCFSFADGHFAPNGNAHQVCRIIENGNESRASALLEALRAAYDAHSQLEPAYGASVTKPVP